MIRLLCEMNNTRKKCMEQGMTSFPAETIAEYEKNYRDMIANGRTENVKTPHKYAKSEEKKLLNRMEKYLSNHLLFLHDFSVPFEDNISERDLRKAKNRQKMAGGFRKSSGHEMYLWAHRLFFSRCNTHTFSRMAELLHYSIFYTH